MKSELFQLEAKRLVEDIEDIEMHRRALKLLINSKITSFAYPPGPGLVSLQAAAFHELWNDLVEERPPDLHTIVCRSLSDDGNVRPIFDSALTAFTGLEVLQIENFVASDVDLCSIADRLPKLR
jgi:hypothetical protein